MWLEDGKIKHTEEAYSAHVYPNTAFVNYVYMCYSSRDDMIVYVWPIAAWDRWYIHEGFLFWIIPSTYYPMKNWAHSLVSPIYLIYAFCFLIILHLTFNSSCIIACLYAHHPYVMGLPSLGALPISHSAARIFPTRRPNSAIRIFPFQSLKFTTPLMGHTHLGRYVNPTLLLEFPPFGG